MLGVAGWLSRSQGYSGWAGLKEAKEALAMGALGWPTMGSVEWRQRTLGSPGSAVWLADSEALAMAGLGSQEKGSRP